MSGMGFFEDLLGPVQGRWLEFLLLPLSLSLTLASGGMAIWMALAGNAAVYPWYVILAYLWFVSMAGAFVTCLHRTKRAEEVGRGMEAIVAVSLPILWQMIPMAIVHWKMEMLPMIGTGSGVPSMIVASFLGLVTWGISILLGGSISTLWPVVDNMHRVKWLKATQIERTDEELGEMAAKEAKARISKAEEASGAFTIYILSISAILLLTSVLRPESHMAKGSTFVLWALVQAITGLISIAGFSYSIKRIGWALHKARIEPGIGHVWILAVLVLTLTAFPAGWGVHSGVKAIQGALGKPRATVERSQVKDQEQGDKKAEGSYNTIKQKESKVGTTRKKATKKPSAGKSRKTPAAVRTIWGLILGIVIGGVLVTTVLVTLSLVVLLLLALIQLIPGLGGALGAGKGLFSTGGMGLVSALTWPFLAVGELLRHGGKEILKALGSGFTMFGKDSLPGRLAKAGGINAGSGLARMRKGRRIKQAMKSGSSKAQVMYQYLQLLLHMERKGIKREPVETPAELQKKLSNPGDLRDRVESITNAFHEARYSPTEPQTTVAMQAAKWAKEIIKRFRKSS